MAREFALSAKSKSSAYLFWDVRTAFYTVLRPLVVDTVEQGTQKALDRLIATIGLNSTERSALLNTLERDLPALEAAEVSPHLRDIVAESLSGTWFKVANACHVIHTSRGTRPGDPLADLLFIFSWPRFLLGFTSA
jgi:hypothetical protein